MIYHWAHRRMDQATVLVDLPTFLLLVVFFGQRTLARSSAFLSLRVPRKFDPHSRSTTLLEALGPREDLADLALAGRLLPDNDSGPSNRPCQNLMLKKKIS